MVPRADVTPFERARFGMQNHGIRSNRGAASVYVWVEGVTAANALFCGMALVASGPGSRSTVVRPRSSNAGGDWRRAVRASGAGSSHQPTDVRCS